MKTQSLKLALIHCDSGTQSRVYINEEAVAEYAERMHQGDKFPAVDAFFDGTDYHLADGFHRVMASERVGFKDILCNVHKGTAIDALWFSIGANRANGVKRSPGDVRKSIEIALTKFPEKTQDQIAAQVGCSQEYVRKIQGELTTSCKLKLPAKRKGKDGKLRPTKYSKQSAPEPVEEPEEEQPRVETLDEKWGNATGGIKLPEPELTPLQIAVTDLDYVCNDHKDNLKSAKDKAEFKARLIHWSKEF